MCGNPFSSTRKQSLYVANIHYGSVFMKYVVQLPILFTVTSDFELGFFIYYMFSSVRRSVYSQRCNLTR